MSVTTLAKWFGGMMVGFAVLLLLVVVAILSSRGASDSAKRAAVSAQRAAQSVHYLIVSGRTHLQDEVATQGHEIQTLVVSVNGVQYLVHYVQRAQHSGQKATRMFLVALERHIDATIYRAVRRSVRHWFAGH